MTKKEFCEIMAVGAWGFLLAGAVMFPIGIIHGLGIWIGVWP